MARLSGQSSHEPQHQTLQQELTGDLATAGPQGCANRHLLLTPLGPHEEEVGHVGAGDHQDDPSRAQEEPQNAPDVTDVVQFQWTGVGTPLRLLETGERGGVGSLLHPHGQHPF